MQKKNLFVAACFTIAAIASQAQHKETVPVPVPPAPPSEEMAPPPPPPPVPAAPAVKEINELPPAPPAPPTPPQPRPAQKKIKKTRTDKAMAIINNHGYEMSVRQLKGIPVVRLEKNAKAQSIKLSNWKNQRKFYETKFGQLPPVLFWDLS